MVAVAGLSMSIMACSDSNSSALDSYHNVTQYNILSSKVSKLTDNQRVMYDTISPNLKGYGYGEKIVYFNGKSLNQMNKECIAFKFPEGDLQKTPSVSEYANNLVKDKKRSSIVRTINYCVDLNVKILQQGKFVDNGDGTGYVTGSVR